MTYLLVGCRRPKLAWVVPRHFFVGRNDCSLLKPHSVQNRKFDHKTRKAVNFVIIKFVFIGRETGLRVYRRLSFLYVVATLQEMREFCSVGIENGQF